MIVKRAIRNRNIVAGGGACEVHYSPIPSLSSCALNPNPLPSKLTCHLPQMEISAHLHRSADLSVPRKQQSIIKSFAKALEIIPRQLCDNAGFDATNILTQLRVEHRKGNTWAGVDFDNEGVRDNMEAFVWEPSLVKINAVQAATEAACLILSVDETIRECILPRFVKIVMVFYCEVKIVADFYCRKPGVRATTGAAARIASWSGAEGNERKRERNAEEVMIMLYHGQSKRI